MKVWSFLPVLFTVCLLPLAAEEFSQEKLQQLQRKTREQCAAGELGNTFLLIDHFYSADNTRLLPPDIWAADEKIADLVGKYAQEASQEDAPGRFLASCASGFRQLQARFELYHGFTRSEQKRLEREGEETRKLIGELAEQLMKVEDRLFEASTPELTAQQEKIKQEIARLQERIDGAVKKRTREVMEWYLNSERVASPTRFYGILAAAEGYHREFNPTPEDGRSVLEILALALPGAEPDSEAASRLREMKIEALLRVNRAADALPLIEEQAKEARFQDSAGKAFILLLRGRAQLQLKRLDEARLAADQLAGAEITTEPLCGSIQSFVSELEQVERQN